MDHNGNGLGFQARCEDRPELQSDRCIFGHPPGLKGMLKAVNGEDLLLVAILQNPVDLSGSSCFGRQRDRGILLHDQVCLRYRKFITVLNQWSDQRLQWLLVLKTELKPVSRAGHGLKAHLIEGPIERSTPISMITKIDRR